MQVYWKVHINNFDSFIEYILKKYEKFSVSDLKHFKNYYNYNEYLYLLIDNNYISIDYKDYYEYRLTYADCDDRANNWLGVVNNWNYMGEFRDRKNKLLMLDKISKL